MPFYDVDVAVVVRAGHASQATAEEFAGFGVTVRQALDLAGQSARHVRVRQAVDEFASAWSGASDSLISGILHMGGSTAEAAATVQQADVDGAAAFEQQSQALAVYERIMGAGRPAW